MIDPPNVLAVQNTPAGEIHYIGSFRCTSTNCTHITGTPLALARLAKAINDTLTGYGPHVIHCCDGDDTKQTKAIMITMVNDEADINEMRRNGHF